MIRLYRICIVQLWLWKLTKAIKPQDLVVATGIRDSQDTKKLEHEISSCHQGLAAPLSDLLKLTNCHPSIKSIQVYCKYMNSLSSSRQFPSLGGPIGILKFISLSWLTAVPHTISGVKSTESITCSARRLSSSLSLWILAARSYEGEIILPLCLKIDYWPHATNYFHHVLSHRIGVFIVASLVHGDTCPMTCSRS